MISRPQNGANVKILIVHLNLDHESCPNPGAELAAGQKSLCPGTPDRGRAVESPLCTAGQRFRQRNAGGGKQNARYPAVIAGWRLCGTVH
jgi:hypothetical protein